MSRGRLFFLNALRSFFLETTLFLGLSRQVFSRKDEPRTRKTRAAAVTLHPLAEQLQVARAPFFYKRNEKLFFGTTLYLGLSRQVFSRKDEPRTRNTRAAAVTLHPLAEQLQVARAPFFYNRNEKLFFGTTLYLGLSRQVFSRKDEPRTRNTRAARAIACCIVVTQTRASAIVYELIGYTTGNQYCFILSECSH